MAIIAPVVSNSQSLITPGYPMVSVAKSNPISVVVHAEKPAPATVATSITHQKVLTQSGHGNDRST
jgi:hypothetical protein